MSADEWAPKVSTSGAYRWRQRLADDGSVESFPDEFNQNAIDEVMAQQIPEKETSKSLLHQAFDSFSID